jgi:hypothetical protein
MSKTDSTRKAFVFLQKHTRSGRVFTMREFSEATGWSIVSVKTYLSKKLGELVQKEGEKLRAKAEVLRFTEDEFLGHMTQVKPVFTEYRRKSHELITYEFFLPLTREDKLRRALDAPLLQRHNRAARSRDRCREPRLPRGAAQSNE